MADEHKDYKRTPICNFCPFNSRCTKLREDPDVLCGACQQTLTCAQKTDLDWRHCEEMQRIWHRDLPRKCILAQQLLGELRGPDGSCVTQPEKQPQLFVLPKDFNSYTLCPRCSTMNFTYGVTYSRDPAALHVVKGQIKGTCGFCGLDETN